MGFWNTFWAVTIHPLQSLIRLSADPAAVRKGWLALGFVLAVYTSIVATLLGKGLLPISPSLLPVPLEQQYLWQLIFQGPLFVLVTLLSSGFLHLLKKPGSKHERYWISFARTCFVSTVPFALTMMLVEFVLSILLLSNAVSPSVMHSWLTGQGAWFAMIYQLTGVIWLMALFLINARVITGRSWLLSTFAGIGALVLYMAPVGLLVR